MRILLVADGRSPTTRRWTKTVRALGHEVTLITTYPCLPVEGVEADVCLPVAFSSLLGPGGGVPGTGGVPGAGRPSAARRVISSFRSLFLAGRYLLGPLTLRYYAPRFRWLVERIQPDVIHALRIPFEGMLAASAPREVPLAVSIWGNDLTLHAHGSPAMARLTRKVLKRADALVVDTQRDIRLASAWGFAREKPSLVVPGSGGVNLAEIQAVRERVQRQGTRFDRQFDPSEPLVLNPRGFRTGSVRQDTFFSAVPLVLERRPGIPFACAAMAGQREAERLIAENHLEGKVALLPQLPQGELWELFARAAISVSVSQHDGTPNSLLEAMAFGALPVGGDIESIREWITPGVNGLLVEPDKPQALAEAILIALDHPELRQRAAECNARIVAERASTDAVREKIWLFYEALAASGEIPV